MKKACARNPRCVPVVRFSSVRMSPNPRRNSHQKHTKLCMALLSCEGEFCPVSFVWPRCPYGQALEIASGVAAGIGKRGGGRVVGGGARLNRSRWIPMLAAASSFIGWVGPPVEYAAAYLYGLCGAWCVLSECLYVTAALHGIHAGGNCGGVEERTKLSVRQPSM